MNAEQLEDHFDGVDETQLQPGGTLHFTAEEVKLDPAAVLVKVCGIYQIVRPFISWAAKFFLIPKKIKNILTQFITLMDQVCPA